MNTTATTSPLPEVLRERMVDQIGSAGHARSLRVEKAMRAVPRHEFVPLATLEDAYDDIAVITKRADNGAALSCASVPTVVAMMLDQLDVRPGDRILEIGAGTGYNAALLTRLTGPDGHVTTVDIDLEVTSGARLNLDKTGNDQVKVITRDGSLGAEEHAPYDRIIFTVGAWDLPPAFWTQLAPGGRLVVPLRWRGQTRSIAFVRDDDRLTSDSVELCGFVPMIGHEHGGELTGELDDRGLVSLYWDDDQQIDVSVLDGVLTTEKAEAWSGVSVGCGESFDGVWLRMTATEPGTCRVAVQREAIDSGLCKPAIPSRSPALVEGSSLAYFTYRLQVEGVELGAIGHGPQGAQLAERICNAIRAWDGHREARPTITAQQTALSDGIPGASTITKPISRLTISF